jgi:hypothetical protein
LSTRVARTTGLAALGALTLLGGLWWGMHHLVGFAPVLVDGLRSVIGPRAVAWIEDRAYSLEDTVHQKLHGSEPPVTLWQAGPALPKSLGFPPAAATPPFPRVAHAEDGHWSAVPGMPPSMARTLLHSDPARSYSAVAVVAIDLRRVELRMKAGTQEPISDALPRTKRTGLVDASDLPRLLAAWDGGFKTMHGHFGMMTDGALLLPPLPGSCTAALYANNVVRIGTWTTLASTEPAMLGFRQTPPCLVENGAVNPAVDAAHGIEWGAAVDGATIIRRSAMGIDAQGETLFVGLGERVSTRALADGMQAAGAAAAAQMDVNYAYVRFLLYGDPSARHGARPTASPLIPLLLYSPTEYVTQASPRDFFYAVTKN